MTHKDIPADTGVRSGIAFVAGLCAVLLVTAGGFYGLSQL